MMAHNDYDDSPEAIYDDLGDLLVGHYEVARAGREREAEGQKAMMAHELIRRSAETGERLHVGWDPVLIIGLKALGGTELERSVYSGNDRDGRQWIVDMTEPERKDT